jgi:protein-S-isoprenylcysteine O-methyltransferase Ste14
VFWRIVKTLVFTIVVPGTVAVYIPQTLKGSRVSLPVPFPWIGVALIGCGAAIYLWCAWDFAVKGLGTPAPIDAPRVLVVNGLYRFSRNPMYAGVFTAIEGQALYYGSGHIAVYGCVMLTIAYVFVVLYEEPTLRRLFGNQYDEYCRRVPRWLIRFRRT